MLGAHDLSPRWLKLHKRAPTSTTTRRRTTSATATTATTAAPVVATTSPTSFGRSGAAYVATGADRTVIAATTPPANTAASSSVPQRSFVTTLASENSSYHPNASGATSALVAGSSAGSSSADSSSGTGAKPVLSQTALIAIIAGGGALVLILIATVACCCWKRKKAKKDEAQWWKLNESQASVGGAVGAATAMRSVGKETVPSRGLGGAGGAGGEKDWDRSFGDEKAAPGRRFDNSSSLSGPQSFGSREVSSLQSAREELFAAPGNRSGSPSSQHRPQQPQPQHQPPQRGPNLVLSRDESSLSLHSQYPPPRLSPSPAPSQAHTERSLYSHPSASSTAVPLLSQAPSRPPRPSEVPSAAMAPKPSYLQEERPDRRDTQDRNQQLESRFREVMTGAIGRPDSDAVRDEDTEQKKKRQSMLRRKKDTLMNFTDAYGQADDEGETDWDHTPSPAADTALIPPQRSSSKRAAGQRLPSATPPMPNSPGDSYFPPSSPAESASFPPQSRSAFAASEDITRRQPRYSSRVDSKPLRELEDILDSFADDPRRTTQPPLPADDSSLRSASVHSAMSNTSPLQYPRAPGSGMVASSSSSSSLFAPGVPYGSYALNHHHNSFHSSAGDIGNTSPVKSRSGAPLSSPPLSTLSSSSDLAADHPLAAPSRHIFNPSTSSSVFSSADEASSPVVATTQMVRKISIKKDNDAPVRLTRNASLQHHQQHQQQQQQQLGASRPTNFATPAERDLYSQMMFDGSPRSGDGVPSASNSSTTTPTTPLSSPPIGGQQRQKDPVVVGDHHGFAPLSSHNLDVSYRSATLSIYGLYDDDDAPNELKGLPMSDPRVSRHLSGLYPAQAAR